MQNTLNPSFRGSMLGTSTGIVSSVTSGVIRMTGNKAVASIIVGNISASATLTVAIDYSYEGQMFKEGASTTATAFGYTTLALTGVDAPFIRMRASLAGTSVTVIFDCTLDTSAQ